MQKQIIILILNLVSVLVMSQSSSFDINFDKANRYFNRGDYQNAEGYLLSCYKMDSSNVDVWIKLNQVAIKQKNWKRVALLSNKLKKKLPLESVKYSKQEITAYFNIEDYERADKQIKSCFKKHKLNTFEIADCRKLAADITFAKEAVKHPVPFVPVNLGRTVNSKYAEYLPNLTQDGKYLIYTRMAAMSHAFPSLQEDFYISKNKAGVWTKSLPLSHTLNTKKNEGAPSISADGSVLFFAACNRKDGEGSCDIYYSFNRGNYWTTPKNARAINTDHWDSQPNLSSDGKTLYFASDRDGGVGGRDIWAVDVLGEGVFGKPYNLGVIINTKYDEMSPFIHFDNQTLYFASDGWPGMGEKDIFLCRRLTDNTWSDPQNLGYPINSSKSDNSLFVSADGSIAYFTSSRAGGYGKEDIYQFNLYEKARPKRTAFYRSIVLAADTKKTLEVFYTITDSKDSIIKQKILSKNGEITLSLKAEEQYSISAYADGYLYYSALIDSVSEDSLKTIEQKIFLEPIKKDKQFELKNIEFDFDKSTLRERSTKELDLFVDYLKANPKVKIMIEGHTDNKGKADYNLKLSQERANSVKAYIVSEGIACERIQTKGYGSAQMLSNEERLQDKNRRVVVRIINNV